MSFIKVRIYDQHQPEQHDIYLNTSHIVSLEQVDEGYCLISLSNKETVRVENKAEDILKMAHFSGATN